MKVLISGHGAAQVLDQEVDWPFPTPPVVGMRVKWDDLHGNTRFGNVDLVSYDVTRGVVSVAVQIT